MIKSSKVGVVLASAVGVAFLTLSGCASQQSGAATPANIDHNCRVVSSCKGMATCKGTASCKAKHSCKHHHHHAVETKTTTTTTN